MTTHLPPPRSSDEQEEDDEAPPKPQKSPWKRPHLLATAVVAIIILAFIFSRGRSGPAPQGDVQQTSIGVVATYDPPSPPPPALPPVTKVAEEAPPPPMGAPSLVPFGSGPTTVANNDGHAVIRPAVISYDNPFPAPPQPVTPPAPKEPPHSGLHFATATLPGLKASPAIDDTYQLMPGILPCILDTQIDSNLPGPFFCHLPGPVYSPKGVKLMDAMTQVRGDYESMTNNGVSRLKAVTAVAHIPVGEAGQIWVNLAGQPAADDLGATGLTGNIDHHYLARFAGAVLLDLGQAGLQIAQAQVSKAGSFYVNANSSGGLAEQILNSTINLPPTFTKAHGSPIGILLTEPVDFSDAYKVMPR